jgi:hypothetical protein
MSITVVWADTEEKTTLLWTFSGKWTWADYDEARAVSRSLTAGLGYPIYSIADFSKSPLLPKNALSRFQASAERSAFELALSVIVSKSTMIETFVNVVKRVYPKLGKKLATASTVDEAFSIIAERKKIAANMGQP